MNTIEQYGELTAFKKIVGNGLRTFEDNSLQIIRTGLFNANSLLETATINFVDTICSYGFMNCEALYEINAEQVRTIETSAFSGDVLLDEVYLPKTEMIGSTAFYNCKKLTKIVFNSLQSIGNQAFAITSGAGSLTQFVITTPEIIVSMPNSATAYTFKNNTSKLKVYVPDDLVDSYKSATNWSTIADKIYPLSELPADEEES